MGPERLASLIEPWLAGDAPVYVAVSAGVRSLALDGRLPVGTRLPSERALAGVLGVNRTTVSAAYDVLRQESYLHSAHGAGSRIGLPSTPAQRPDAHAGEPAEVLDLTVAALPAPGRLPDAARAAAADLSTQLAGHGLHPFGLPALRAAVARHLTGRGLETRAEQVLVTSGVLQGWNLCCARWAAPVPRCWSNSPPIRRSSTPSAPTTCARSRCRSPRPAGIGPPRARRWPT
jgi:DNA-binding transcriptional MocR family regulator